MDRLNPAFFSGRYYHLKKLRECNEHVVATYLKDKNRASLLDYGCGDRPYKPLFDPHVGRYLGADIDLNQSADILIDRKTGRVDTEEQFDVLLSTQVLEHVTDPATYLQEAHRLLQPDGLLILSTHGYWIYHPDPTDFWRWTRDGLEKIIVREGFEIVETLGIFNRFASGLQIFQDGLFFKIPKPLRFLWTGWFALFQLILDNGSLHNRDASVFMVVARKINKTP